MSDTPDPGLESAPALSKLPDADLVARCANGDEAAWRTLVFRYRRLVYTIPYRMGLDPDDADDVFQIAFTRLAERIRTMKKPERVRAWLVTTARRVSLDVAGRRRDPEPDALKDLADPAGLPLEEVMRLEEEQLVKAAVDALGGRCRDLLTKLYYPDPGTGQSTSYEAVAATMGIPVGSVGPTRIRCLKRLLAQYRKLSEE